METDRLIRRLAADGARVGAPGVDLRLALAAAGSLAAAAAIVLLTRGLRADLTGTLLGSAGVAKFGGALALAAAAFALLRRLCRPGDPVVDRPCLCLFAGAAALVAAAIGAAGRTAPVSAILASTPHYASMMALVSLAPLALVMLALRTTAPTRFAATGAAGGLFAGALACLGWALWCPADDALFVAVSYGAMVATCAAAGAALGPLVLRW